LADQNGKGSKLSCSMILRCGVVVVVVVSFFRRDRCEWLSPRLASPNWSKLGGKIQAKSGMNISSKNCTQNSAVQLKRVPVPPQKRSLEK
jgi:hypothetical protein